jgi:hypothetical protein
MIIHDLNLVLVESVNLDSIFAICFCERTSCLLEKFDIKYLSMISCIIWAMYSFFLLKQYLEISKEGPGRCEDLNIISNNL